MQHQHSTATYYNRYPEIFEKCKTVCKIKNMKKPKILSFGCSGGDEVFSLNEMYFPTSEIHGVDVNFTAIQKARKLNDSINNKFYLYQNMDTDEKFDIIFCMSVFCKWPQTKNLINCNEVYQFASFENELEKLDSKLNDGGILVIYNSNFCFSDTKLYNKYTTIKYTQLKKHKKNHKVSNSGFVDKFDKNGDSIKYNYNECIFLKKKSNKNEIV